MTFKTFCTSIAMTFCVCFLSAQDLMITGLIHPAATPKTIELYVVNDIPDLSLYGIGVANNGGGSDGEEYTFPADAVLAGDFIYVTNSNVDFNIFFGLVTTYESSIVSFNGDDPVELFGSGVVIDSYADVADDGTGLPWEYSNSFATRVCGTGPDVTFVQENWNIAPLNNFVGSTTNGDATISYPIGSYVSSCPPQGCTNASACNFDPLAVDENGSCILVGDACDDADSGTENDTVQGDCSCAGTLITVTNSLVLTGLIHAEAAPKAIELYVVNDIADLSTHGIGSAGNGGGTDGEEFTFPADAVTAGTFIYVTNDLVAFSDFFGFAADYTDAGAALNFNGDDAFEIFENGAAVDVFGEISLDGTGTTWEYSNGWVNRLCATGPDGALFIEANWTMSSLDAFVGQTANATTPEPFPNGTYLEVCPPVGCTNVAACNYDSEASIDDGTCILIGDACDDENAFSTGDVIQGDCSCAGVLPPTSNSLILSGVLYPDATPKTIELYVVNDIADLSVYGFGVANNGGGTDGQEFTFPADAATAGDFIYVTNDDAAHTAFFGGTANYITSSVNFNGDDAIEIFESSQVIDVYGDINVDGTGTTWGYVDTWVARKCATGPDGSTFVEANWDIAPEGTYTGQTDNATTPIPFALGAYADVCPAAGCTDSNACNFDPTALTDDGSCILPGTACDDANPFTTGDILQADCSCAGMLIPTTNSLILSGIIYPGAAPKCIEIYVAADIADLSAYGFGVASNGGGTDGQEFTFPADAATTGDYIYIANDAAAFTTFFGFAPNYESSVLSFNGDDSVELFENTQVIDSFGDIAVDGTGTTWEYVITWANRICATGPDGAFVEANWTIAAQDIYAGVLLNADAPEPFPVGEFGPLCVVLGCTNPAATNFDPAATADDGSCEILGCTYAIAINFNPDANDDDGSCAFDCENNCPADITQDAVVNTSDLLVLLGAFGNICD